MSVTDHLDKIYDKVTMSDLSKKSQFELLGVLEESLKLSVLENIYDHFPEEKKDELMPIIDTVDIGRILEVVGKVIENISFKSHLLQDIDEIAIQFEKAFDMRNIPLAKGEI